MSDPFSPRSGFSLEWSSVNLSITSSTNRTLWCTRYASEKKQKKIDILSDLNGCVLPYSLTAIMGHSGAGKSSLLNVLSGKLKKSKRVDLSCRIKFDDQELDPRQLHIRRKIAFVAQRDSLLGTDTPRQAIRFSARLRLPASVSDAQVDSLTATIIHELGLDEVADKQIESGPHGGLSGGEMRRVSLGIEVVVRPSILLVDEVTSGLDSHNALLVVNCLKKLSQCGASVMFTVHQPSSQIFAISDHLILLHGGRCMYQGSVESIPEDFAARGYEIPPNFNPADWVVHVSQTSASEQELELKGFFDDDTPEARRRSSIQARQSSAALKTSNESLHLSLVSKNDCRSSILKDANRGDRLSFKRELSLVVKRDCAGFLLNKTGLMLRVGSFAIGAALMAALLYGVASSNLSVSSASEFQSHVGVLFIMCLANIHAHLVLLEYVAVQPRCIREVTTGHYTITSFALSRAILDFVTVLLQTIVFHLITYWTIGFQGRFWYLLVVYFGFAMVMASIGVFLASVSKDANQAKEFIPMILLPQFLLCGFFIAPPSLPEYIRWLQYAMPLTYTFRLALGEEFSYCDDNDGSRALFNCFDTLGKSNFYNPDGEGGSGFFRNNTTLTVAQTGTYKGPDGITEYQNIASAGVDPGALVWNRCTVSRSTRLVSHELFDGGCTVTAGFIVRGDIASTLATEATISERKKLLSVQAQHITLSTDKLGEGFIESIGVFIGNTFLRRMLVDFVDRQKAIGYICTAMESHCQSTFNYNNFTTLEDCTTAMDSLPMAEFVGSNNEENLLIDGNTIGCRIIHSALTFANGTTHCPHISFLPQKDESDEFKCTASRNLTEEDLFTVSELSIIKAIGASFNLRDEQLFDIVPESSTPACRDAEDDFEEALREYVPTNVLCLQYLDVNRALDNEALYWCVLLAMAVLFRIAGMWTLRAKVL